MKFSYQLAFNAFAPWSDHYVQYKKLKKLIKRQRREEGKKDSNENWVLFRQELLKEIDKFGFFFTDMLLKLNQKLHSLSVSLPEDPKGRKSATELFLQFSELKKFIFLNAEGSRKLVKKFDKLNATSFMDGFIQSSYVIQKMISEQKSIDQNIAKLVCMFADAFTEGDVDAASSVLSKSLTDLVEWEKGTIWSDLLRLERNKSRIGTRAITEVDQKQSNTRFFANLVVLILSALAYFESFPGLDLPFHASRCLAVLLLVSGWWSLETFPLFVSALAVPLLVVVCDVIPNRSRVESANLVLSHMWGGPQAMVLASFALAAALSKQRLDKQLACVIISVIRNGREKIMIALMFIGWSASFAIGNMASSILCLSLAAPILDELPQLDPATGDFGKRLLIAIAFACNFGGMTSPIASPQNIVAFASLQKFDFSFSQWILVAVPTSFILLIASFWFLLPVPLHPHASSLRQPLLSNALPSVEYAETIEQQFEVQSELPPRLTDAVRKKNFTWDWRRQAVLALLVFAAALWMATSFTVSQFGDVGLASLLPLLLLFALPGVLNKSDFLSMPWDVCLLLAAGGVLSLAVSESNLLAIAGLSASAHLEALPPFICLVIACVFVTIVSTGVSHTAAANVLMPFIVELGTSAVGSENAVRFILPVSLCLSAGMALPVSSCPNMNATAMSRSSDESVPWVRPSDYLRPGIVLSCISVAVFVLVADPLTSLVCAH